MTDNLTRLLELRTLAAKPPVPSPPRVSGDQLLAAMVERAVDLEQAGVNGESTWADVKRICALPLSGPLDKAEVEYISRQRSLESAFRGGFRFFEEQARAVTTFEMFGGLLGAITVGGGKTLIDACIAHIALTERDVKRSLCLVPSQNVATFARQLPRIRSWVPLSVTFHFVQGPASERSQLARSGMPGCYVMPYSLLSAKDASDILNWIEPGHITADEVQRLARRSAARADRIKRYLEEHRRTTFAGMSGTITNRSLDDYWHLIRWALGDNAPVPMTWYLKTQLKMVLDSQADPSREQMQFWTPLRRWAQQWFPEEGFDMDVAGLRRAYRVRLNHCPGVVCSGGENRLDTKLVIRNRPVPVIDAEGRKRQEELMKQVVDLYIAPNGEDIVHAIHTHKWLSELTAGFYNNLIWPTVEFLMRARRLDKADAQTLLDKALEHHRAVQEYDGELRRWLTANARDGIDTPNLVGMSMHAYKDKWVGAKLYGYWKKKKDLERKDLPERDAVPVRVCADKITAAVAWAQRHDGGVIWVYHREVGAWVYQALQDIGIKRVEFFAAGAKKDIEDPDLRSTICVASIMSHGTGKNLQYHQNQLFVEWPRPAGQGEQTLGRTHRTGQEADVIYADTFDSNDYDAQARAAGLIDSLYQSQTVGTPMKVIYAEYDPLPKMFPPQVLRERGFENKLLNEMQQLMLKEKFTVTEGLVA